MVSPSPTLSLFDQQDILLGVLAPRRQLCSAPHVTSSGALTVVNHSGRRVCAHCAEPAGIVGGLEPMTDRQRRLFHQEPASAEMTIAGTWSNPLLHIVMRWDQQALTPITVRSLFSSFLLHEPELKSAARPLSPSGPDSHP